MNPNQGFTFIRQSSIKTLFTIRYSPLRSPTAAPPPPSPFSSSCEAIVIRRAEDEESEAVLGGVIEFAVAVDGGGRAVAVLRFRRGPKSPLLHILLQSHLLHSRSYSSGYDYWIQRFSNEKVCSRSDPSTSFEPLELEDDDFVTSFDYLMEKESLLIGTSKGLLLLYSVDNNSTEIVGRVEGGVKCISPSPDGDLLAVTTAFGQLLVITQDWDVLYETEFEDHTDVDQFQDQTVNSDISTRRTGYSPKSPISWRGDGKYLATLSKVQDSSLLQIKVWERDSSALHSASDPRSLSPAVLDWMPSGAKIATVYERKEETSCPLIAFFERNGLERSTFSINEPSDAKVEVLKWNSTSDLLAGTVRCEKYDCVKIWYFSNNHWYLKHEIRYSRQDGARLMWDPIKPLKLICWTLGGQVSVYDFIWVTAVMANSVALVVDDFHILVTPLSLTLTPPPMFSFSLNFSCPVREIAFLPGKSRNLLAAFLSNGCLCIAELPSVDDWDDLEEKDFEVEASTFKIEYQSLLHLEWLDSHTLLGASHLGLNHKAISSHSAPKKGDLGSSLVEIETVCSEDNAPGSVTCSGWHAEATNQILLEGSVINIARDPVKRRLAYIEFDSGTIIEYIPGMRTIGADGTSSIRKHSVNFSSPCPWMIMACVDDGGVRKPLLTGLDEHGRLHVDGRILCNNCGCFSLYSNSSDEVATHLILATKQDLLYIVDMVDVVDGEAESKYDSFLHVAKKKREEQSSKFINLWERSAKVVGVLHGDEAAVILQTTRGNLECIYPRKLVLACIVNALVQGRFRDAFLMVRRHRIEFNFMVDYCGWKAFLPFSSEFVRQVKNLSHVTEFVCAIKKENTSEKLYTNYISFSSSKEVKDAHEEDQSDLKVTSVLSAIRKALEEELPENPAREFCILTTYARSDPPALEEALKRIKITREMELSGSNDSRCKSYPSAEEALKHLLWLSDPDAVFEAALGLYDLNLAAIVALNAQKDPKEFLPFLQELENLPTVFMQYKIDLHLHRYDKALEHIVSAGDAYHSECVTLLKHHPQLFPLGLKLVIDPLKRKEVNEAWGDYLFEQKCFEDAATAFLCCSNLEKALKAYRSGGGWSGVLTVAGLLKLGKAEVLQLAHELAEELQELGRPGEAAKVVLEYCEDINYAITLFIRAREWEEALRVAFMYRNDDSVAEVRRASSECAVVLANEFQEGLEKIGKYTARYLAVRQRRLLLAAKLQSEERGVDDIDYDTVSEASSNFSGMSAYTTRTKNSSAVSASTSAASKRRENRRKKNRGKIRAGSPGEEIALVDHLRSMSLTSGAKRELKSLLSVILMLDMEETAKKLQCLAETFQLSQIAAVRLAEDTVATESIDEHAFTLDRYLPKVKGEMPNLDDFAWRSKVLISS
ncbi:Elongator complex protein 1-like protein [Drosera capensis]